MNELKEWVERHKAVALSVGAVALLGLILVFKRQSANAQSSDSGAGIYGAAVNASLQQQQTAAQLAAQNAQIQGQVQLAQIQANSTDTQTKAAAVAAADQTAAQLAATKLGYDYQTHADDLTAQTTQANLNANVLQNEDDLNYALSLANTSTQVQRDQLLYSYNLQSQAESDQVNLASTELSDATTLATQQQTNFQNNVNAILPNVGKAYNSGLDANNAAALQALILSGGNPSVAATAINSSTNTAVSGNNTGEAKVGAATKLLSNAITGFFG